ncbi:MAG TPA: DinB family protein, partial [Anaerolineae bacterium]|nr:DinB family protein [Anaerolineae bacterium]
MTASVVPQYLEMLDAQREAVLAVLDGLPEAHIWQRPAPKEWSVGEILSHTERFFSSFLPGLSLMWSMLGWYGRLRYGRPYKTQIENVYKRPNFPMWTGFLWKPRHTPAEPVSLATLQAEIKAAHGRVRAFYTGKDPAVLGNIHAYDPAIGVVNLITGLKVGID